MIPFETNSKASLDSWGRNVNSIVKTQDMYGIGGGIIWEYDFGNKSELRLSGLYGHGATDFQGNIGNRISAVNNAVTESVKSFPDRQKQHVGVHASNGEFTTLR